MNCPEAEVGLIVQFRGYEQPLMIAGLDRDTEVAECYPAEERHGPGGWIVTNFRPNGVKTYMCLSHLRHYVAGR